MELLELENKYGLFLVENKRFYKEDLSQRDYALEYSVPERLTILGTTFNEHSWSNLLQEVSIFLHNKKPEINLLDFKVEWGNMIIYTTEAKRPFGKLIYPGVYLYSTFTAQHACWVLQDLLNYFNIGIDNAELIIKRNPGGEPIEVRDYFREKVIGDFKRYLIMNYSFTQDRSDKIVNNILKLNKIMLKVSRSFDDLFLFDSSLMYANYKSRFKEVFLNTELARNIKNRNLVYKYLDYLTDFYRNFGY